jgi:hypothetical protein
MKKCFLLIIFSFLLVGCVNPYIKQLKTYEMQLAEGRDKAFLEAMNRTEQERLDVEDQYSKLGIENALLITALVRSTGKTPDEAMSENLFSYNDILQIVNTRTEANIQRKEQIKSSYKNFFDEIKNQDAKIEAIREGVKKSEEIQNETYVKIGETLGVGLATAGATSALGN